MSKPRLLDLFCKAGGAAVGYSRAGFDIVGVDIDPQPNFPFTFVQADIEEWAAISLGHIRGLWISEFDALHLSPPCQAHTPLSNRWRGKGGAADDRRNLIPLAREIAEASGIPYVIENVVGAPLKAPTRLCGMSLGVGAHRHRLFETNFPLMAPPCAYGDRKSAAVYGKLDGRRLFTRADGSELRAATHQEAADALGIDWMTSDELREAIPPAMTEHIGFALMAHLSATVAA